MLIFYTNNLYQLWYGSATASDACLSGPAISIFHSQFDDYQKIGIPRDMQHFNSKEPLHDVRDAVLKFDGFSDLASMKSIL